FTYLWTNCPDAHCPVLGGRGASGLADFNANKQLTLPDLRGRICSPVGLDDMGNSAAGRILAGNVTSGGGDTVTTPGATGGEANHTMQLAELAAHNHTVNITDPGHQHTIASNSLNVSAGATNVSQTGAGSNVTSTATTGLNSSNVTTVNTGS